MGDVGRAMALLEATPNMATGEDEEGWTPLMSVCLLRHVPLLEKLLELGANVHTRSPFDVESGKGDNPPLWLAANQNRPFCVEVSAILIEHGALVNVVGELGETPLHQAATWNHAELAEYLISMGAYVNAEIVDGKTPLAIANMWNNEEVAAVLRSYGARG